MTVGDPEAVACSPTGQRRREFRRTLVEFQRPVLAQHVAGAAALHQRQPFRLRQRHQRSLRGECPFMGGLAPRAPEPVEPGQKLWQIGWRDRQRTKWIGKPARQVPHHALLGKWQDVGKGQRRSVARTRFLHDPRAIDHERSHPAFCQTGGAAHADDAGADDDDIAFQVHVRGSAHVRGFGAVRAPAIVDVSPMRPSPPSRPSCAALRKVVCAACARGRWCRWRRPPPA